MREPIPDRPQTVAAFGDGTSTQAWRLLGAHPDAQATRFAVWAPNAEEVFVVGSFNDWEVGRDPLLAEGSSGIFVGSARAVAGDLYKYAIRPRGQKEAFLKADPYARAAEVPPRTASVVWQDSYRWRDAAWMQERGSKGSLSAPVSIYEVHLGSFRRRKDGRDLTYREMAPLVAEHVRRQGFTHVEILPVMEHPFYGSWGYETTGYFAPTSRYGTPADFMAFVDTLHRADIGVILDWAPAHFPADAHGLAAFDGTHLYEHADPRRGYHPDWHTLVFNYGRHEVKSFLLSSAHFWCEMFHADGLRVDAVASMLYLDYSRPPGEWVPNVHGGRENLEALAFLKDLNTSLYARFPDIQTFAEESTAWPGVSRPTHLGGLGFGYKWDMGFMHDTLRYFTKDPIHRQFHHDLLTFRSLYAFQENFVLPFSHDEVVHGKGSLIAKMPGDNWQKFANLRLLFAYTYGQPGKKLLFMGDDFAQGREWNHESTLDWDLLGETENAGVARLVADLNRLYRSRPELHAGDADPLGMRLVDTQDNRQNVLSWLRHDRAGHEVLVVCHFSPGIIDGYRVGVPKAGTWHEILNTDATDYGGSGRGNLGRKEAEAIPQHGHPASLSLTLPPLAAVFFAPGEA